MAQENQENLDISSKKNVENYDYCIVLASNIKKSQHCSNVLKFLNWLQGRGVIVDLKDGYVII